MTCKIVTAKEWKQGGISLSILSGIRWRCTKHKIYFATNLEEARPKKCPLILNLKKNSK